MTWQDKTILVVVPARGNSKGVPRKNLQRVGGLSLIAHAARTATALPWVDAAVLSTDDEEMAEEGRKWGLDLPFLRPAELATDTATSIDTWRHAWLECENYYGKRFDVSLLLQPTTPLRKPEEVERTLKTLVDGQHRAAATVGRVPTDFSPARCLTLGGDGTLSFYSSEGASVTRRQEFPPSPSPAAAFDTAFSVHTIYFWPNFEEGLGEIHRTLRPGGRFLIAFHSSENVAVASQLPTDVYTMRTGKQVMVELTIDPESQIRITTAIA